MKVIRADELGFCYGVDRAAIMAEELLGKYNKIYILGMLIHNPTYIKRIEQMGAITVEEEDFLSGKVVIEEGAQVLLRAHGARKKLVDKLEKMNVHVTDTTCPYVTMSMNVKLKEEDTYEVIYIGDENHPEVMAVLSYGKDIKIFNSLEALKEAKLDINGEYSFIVQKTFDYNKFDEIKTYAKKTYKKARFKDDLCGATYERQEAITRLAKEVDMVVVIGGKMSSNSNKLYKIAKEENSRSYFVEGIDEIKKEWFEGISTVGLSAGASTPDYLIDAVETYIENIHINRD